MFFYVDPFLLHWLVLLITYFTDMSCLFIRFNSLYFLLFRTSMCERGWEMIEHLVKIGVGRHPIIWVGHSKGGLFVKQMLVHGNYDLLFLNLIKFFLILHKKNIFKKLSQLLFSHSRNSGEFSKNFHFISKNGYTFCNSHF